MSGRFSDDGERIAVVRERVAAVEQKVVSLSDSYQRELGALRSYFDDKFEAQKQYLKSYIDQKFIEVSDTIRTTPTEAAIDPRFWMMMVVIGGFSAATFVAFITYLFFTRGG